MALNNAIPANGTLTDSQWLKILAFLRKFPRAYVGQEKKCRLFVEAVFWISRTGVQWRLLPKKYGYWNSVYKRFARWHKHGVWEAMHHHFVDDPELKNMIFKSLMLPQKYRQLQQPRLLEALLIWPGKW